MHYCRMSHNDDMVWTILTIVFKIGLDRRLNRFNWNLTHIQSGHIVNSVLLLNPF